MTSLLPCEVCNASLSNGAHKIQTLTSYLEPIKPSQEGVSKYYQGNNSAWCQPGMATTRVFPEYQPQACFSYDADGSYCPQGMTGYAPMQPAW